MKTSTEKKIRVINWWITKLCFELKSIQTDLLSKQKQNLNKHLNLNWIGKWKLTHLTNQWTYLKKRKWHLAVTSFEATNFVFNGTDEPKTVIQILHQNDGSPRGQGPINELKDLLELRSQKDIELCVKDVKKRNTRIEIEDSRYISAGFDHFKKEIPKNLKSVKYKDIEDMVYN